MYYLVVVEYSGEGRFIKDFECETFEQARRLANQAWSAGARRVQVLRESNILEYEISTAGLGDRPSVQLAHVPAQLLDGQIPVRVPSASLIVEVPKDE